MRENPPGYSLVNPQAPFFFAPHPICSSCNCSAPQMAPLWVHIVIFSVFLFLLLQELPALVMYVETVLKKYSKTAFFGFRDSVRGRGRWGLSEWGLLSRRCSGVIIRQWWVTSESHGSSVEILIKHPKEPNQCSPPTDTTQPSHLDYMKNENNSLNWDVIVPLKVSYWLLWNPYWFTLLGELVKLVINANI